MIDCQKRRISMNENYLETKEFLFEKYKKIVFSKKECANILGVSTPTLDRLTKNKKIESMGVSRYVLFSIEEIAKIISGVKSLK
ncbi:helix-turn-helix domain-containing protein [Campylobacter lari]|nr:helix-turn-helix domain-containing protein [Campylobacter lari]